LEAQEANLLPVGYFHVVFTLPAEIADIAFHNKALVYDLLFKAAAVLHTWGSAMTHHPHIHMIVPGGGITPDGWWISSRPAFLLPVRVLGALFGRLFMTRLIELHSAGKFAFFGKLAGLSDRRAFQRHLAPVRRKRWVVYAKAPFAGPEAVLAYLSRYTHRVAISNSRLIAFDGNEVTFRYKDYRRSGAKAARHDSGRRRVHSSIPDPRPVARLPPHPALRPARRRRSKGEPCPGPRHVGGGADDGRTAGHQDRPRPVPALSLLRRHHGDHRDLRGMVPAPGAANHETINPGDCP
jgi:hypothetical protein